MHSHLHTGAQHGAAHGMPGASAAGRPVLDARLELIAILVAIAAIGSEPLGQLLPFAFYLPLVLAYVLLRERSLWPAMLRVAPVLPVLVILALGLPFSRTLDSWLNVAPVSGFDRSGWVAALSLGLRALSAVLLLSTLVKAAGFTEILTALRRSGLPAAVVLTLQHLERYRALIAEEWRRTNQARESRSPGGMRFAFAGYANQTALIFLRSWERSERIHTAMLARGFRIDGPLPAPVGQGASPRNAWIRSFWLPAIALLIRLAV